GLELTTKTIPRGFLVWLHGKIDFLGLMTAEVKLKILLNRDTGIFSMEGEALFKIAGLVEAKVQIAFQIANDGFALAVDVSFDVGIKPIINFSLAGKLFINTRPVAVELNGRSIRPKYVMLSLVGKITIVGILNFEVNATAQVGGVFWRPDFVEAAYRKAELLPGEWAVSLSVKINLFGIAKGRISGFLQSDGSFGFNLYGSIEVGGRFLGFKGSIEVKAYYLYERDLRYFSGSLKITVYLFFFKFSVGATIEYRGWDGKCSLSVSAGGSSKTWTLGYFKNTAPKPVLALDKSNKELADGDSVASKDGEIYLTTELGYKRRFDIDEEQPIYYIEHVSTQPDGSETVQVRFNGMVSTYSGVRKIIAPESIDLDAEIHSTIVVEEGVTSQLDFTGAKGNDAYYVYGGSTSVLNVLDAGTGDDEVLVYSSDPNLRFQINGGPGNNFIMGGNGNDQISVGNGVNYILADQGQFQTDMVTRNFSAMTVNSRTVGGNDVINATSGTNYIIGGLGNDTINGGGSNSVIADEGTFRFGSSGKLQVASSVPSRQEMMLGDGVSNQVILGQVPLSAESLKIVVVKPESGSRSILPSNEYSISGQIVTFATAPEINSEV
ncbi:MAG: hypothetical protein ACKOAU_15315, partial [Pirellula sp.]